MYFDHKFYVPMWYESILYTDKNIQNVFIITIIIIIIFVLCINTYLLRKIKAKALFKTVEINLLFVCD